MSAKQHIRYRIEASDLDIMGLHIHNLMLTEYLPTFVDRSHTHETWQLFYFISGAGIISVNGIEEDVSDGHVAIIRPSIPHYFRMRGNACATAFEIKWQFSDSLKGCLVPPQWSGIFRDRYGLRHYVNQAIEELASRPPNWELMLRSTVFAMLIQVDRALRAELRRVGEVHAETETYGYRHILVHRAKQLVLGQIDRHVSIRDIANALYISPQYLNELFRKETGESFSQWTIDQKLRRACNALKSDHARPIKEIARQVGYDDPRYFSRLFKRKMGTTPTEYRFAKV